MDRAIQTVANFYGNDFSNLRILDLACLSGYYSIEFAIRGANVVGIEGREDNILPGINKKNELKLDNCQFFVDDVRNVTKEKYGEFDVVLCNGILYHLDKPDIFTFLENIYSVCKKILFIDTHISLKPALVEFYKSKEYYGFPYIEFQEGLNSEEKMNSALSSLDNNNSFWFTKNSLANFLYSLGFSSVSEILTNPSCNFSDRVLVYAIKNETSVFSESEKIDISIKEPNIDANYIYTPDFLDSFIIEKNAIIYILEERFFFYYNQNPELAEKIALELIEKNPNSLFHKKLLADILLKNSKFEDSLDILTEIIELEGLKDIETKDKMINILEKIGDKENLEYFKNL
ncbi:MAG: class I SAM-dependent methyltransferase [Cyanobacteriota bacterium]